MPRWLEKERMFSKIFVARTRYLDYCQDGSEGGGGKEGGGVKGGGGKYFGS
jgi:hypothetical protein